ncbi:MAG TPA: fimbrial protein [Buttiauxella sp.]|nr:fimbrial protein [Buttiauxella sp.]
MAKNWLLLCFFSMLYIGCPALANAYLVVGNDCAAPSKLTVSPMHLYLTYSINVDPTSWSNLQPGKYLKVSFGSYGAPYQYFNAKIDCPNLGQKQDGIEIIANITGDSSSYILEPETALLGAATHSKDKDRNVAMFKTSVPGIFIALESDDSGVEGFFPIKTTASNDFTFRVITWASVFITKDYQWGESSGEISMNSSAVIKYSDTKDNSTNTDDEGYIQINSIHTGTPLPAGEIKIKSTCNYSLSKSTVDFGDINLSSITNSKNTTAKQSIILNMKDCYGVNKVKTYITNTTTVLENGLVLGNSTTTNAAANVGIRMNIGSAANENKSADVYMDGTHPLEWNFGNTYDMVSISKEIPLDIFLLKSGGEPTTGDFKATATIMLNFI